MFADDDPVLKTDPTGQFTLVEVMTFVTASSYLRTTDASRAAIEGKQAIDTAEAFVNFSNLVRALITPLHTDAGVSFKTRFTSGAEVEVAMEFANVVGQSGWGHPAPHKFKIKRKDAHGAVALECDLRSADRRCTVSGALQFEIPLYEKYGGLIKIVDKVEPGANFTLSSGAIAGARPKLELTMELKIAGNALKEKLYSIDLFDWIPGILCDGTERNERYCLGQ
jgi:hypothetical protein